MTKELDRRVVEQQPASKKTRRSVREASEPDTQQPARWVRLRLIPIWLRVVLVLLLFAAAAVIGLNVGYSVIGDGESWSALKWDTWQHLLDIMDGKE